MAPDTSATTLVRDAGTWTISVGADETATFECSLDGGAYQVCGSTVTFHDLAKGVHSFSARATDRAGNTDPSPAQLTTKVTGRGMGKG